MQLKPFNQKKKESLPGYSKFTAATPAYVTGYREIGGRFVPTVSTRLSLRDRLADWGVRWDIGRGNYRVESGLYAVGDPQSESPLLVTANYKLSFDRLRTELGGLDAWIVVLDTKGVNVWCAAGKGSFVLFLEGRRRLRVPQPQLPGEHRLQTGGQAAGQQPGERRCRSGRHRPFSSGEYLSG